MNNFILGFIGSIVIIGSIKFITEIQSLKRRIRNVEKTRQNSNKTIFRQISGILKSQQKMVNWVKELEVGFKKEFQNVIHDIDSLFEFNTKEVKTVKNIMEKHNELTEEMYNRFRDLHCELQEGDCTDCEFHSYCTSSTNKGVKASTADSNLLYKEENRLSFNPKDSNSLQELKKAMTETGVPKEIVDNYISYIKNTILANISEDKSIEVVWAMEDCPIDGGVIKHKISSNKTSGEKLIDPNSKIVKTLNDLYNRKESK